MADSAPARELPDPQAPPAPPPPPPTACGEASKAGDAPDPPQHTGTTAVPPEPVPETAAPRLGSSRKRQQPTCVPRRSPRVPHHQPCRSPNANSTAATAKGAPEPDPEEWALGWNNALWPPSKAVEDTLVRAEAAAATLTSLTGIRVMLPSYVTGDYWLQLPMKFAASLPQVPGRHMLTLREASEATETRVTWLRLPDGSGGLTGNWKGFATAHNLAVGDVVLFERASPTGLRAHIFHAITEAERRALAASDAPTTGRKAPDVPLEVQSVARRVKSRRQTAQSLFEAEYEVEAIEGHCVGPAGDLFYLTAWKGFHRRTWEPRCCFVLGDIVTAALAEYEQANALSVTQRGDGASPFSGSSAASKKSARKRPVAPEATPTPTRRKGGAAPELEYEVDAVLDHATGEGGHTYYLTAWKGYTEQTWEPRGSFVLGDVVTNALLKYEREKGLTRRSTNRIQR
eukprot:GGOE01001624.1.p1 GENE.GGOE01001624.1~~GGOE01001624.1.p1  ORF type:complete len:465 (-),score=86.21 GGOE01001624.1:267-1640(-)